MKNKSQGVLPLSSREIGVMQGRLLPKYKGRYQAHPVGYWEEEFDIASEIKLNCIEFILDYNDVDENPLMSRDGCARIAKISNQTGVKVKTICADYFMEAPLHSNSSVVAKKSAIILHRLIENASEINVTDIVIPLVDKSSVINQTDRDRFIQEIKAFISDAKSHQINLCLETDLNAYGFKKLLNEIGSDCVTVNYDIGNSAGLGFDPVDEFAAYGNQITDLHIKDRVVGGFSVELGSGDADFTKVLHEVVKCGYTGPFIMQALRDEEGLSIFKQQLKWLRSTLENFDQSFGI